MRRSQMMAVFILLVAALALFAAAPAAAKGPAEMIRISGPGLDGHQTLREPEALDSLSLAALEDFTRPIEAPQQVGPGYTITRYYDTNEWTPWDQVIYYPDPQGGAGRIFYVGIFNGWSEYDGHWFAANPQSEALLLDWLEQQGVQPGPVQGGAPASGGPAVPGWVGAILAALIGLLAGTAVARIRPPEPAPA